MGKAMMFWSKLRPLFVGRRRRANYVLAVLWCSTAAFDFTRRWMEGIEWSTFSQLMITLAIAWIWWVTTAQRLLDIGLSTWWWTPLYFAIILPLPTWLFLEYKQELLAVYILVAVQLPLLICDSDRFNPKSRAEEKNLGG
jgi:uncharacterized membrane protein YhaH (DUF805 family)